MSKKFDWKSWAWFGAVYGLISGLLTFGLLSWVGSVVDLGVLGGVIGFILIPASVLMGVLVWVLAGFVYERFLVNSLKNYGNLGKLWAAGFTITLLVNALLGTLSIIGAISTAIMMLVVLVITLFVLSAVGRQRLVPLKTG